jgi:hypothetical protein
MEKGNQRVFLIFFSMPVSSKKSTSAPFFRGMALFGPFSALMVACSLWETQPFYPSPFQSRMMALLPVEGKPNAFLFEEWFQFNEQGHLRDTLMYSGTLEWSYLKPDSSGKGFRFQRRAMTDGTLGRRIDTVTAIIDDQGWVVTAQDFMGGGLLPNLREKSMGFDQPWNILPSQLQLGDQWRWSRGNWVCTQTISGMDTLTSEGNLVQAWVVQETLTNSKETISKGTYWFGNEGLLKAEWVWDAMDIADDNADDLGRVIYKRVLRRKF